MRSGGEIWRNGGVAETTEIEELFELSEVLALRFLSERNGEAKNREKEKKREEEAEKNVFTMDHSKFHGFYPPQMDRPSVVCPSVTGSSFLDSTSSTTTPTDSVAAAAAAASTNFDFDTTNAFTSFSQHLSSFPLHLYNASHGMSLANPTGVTGGAADALHQQPSSAESMLYNNMHPAGHTNPQSMFHGVPNIASRPYDAFLDSYAMAAMRPSVFAPSRDTVLPSAVANHDRATIDSLSTPYSPYSSLRSPTTASLPPSLTPSSIPTTPQLARNRCMVCISADSNGLHFGAKTCAACAAFFRRSISDKKKYSCKRTSRCVIHVTDTTGYRKICRNCRMKRCLEVGMLPENVQNKRQRIPPPQPRSSCVSGNGASSANGSSYGQHEHGLWLAFSLILWTFGGLLVVVLISNLISLCVWSCKK